MTLAKWLIILVLSCLTEIVWAACVTTLTDRDVIKCLALTFALPWIQFCSFKWFIDAKRTRDRVLQTFAAAVGSAFGCWVVLVVF